MASMNLHGADQKKLRQMVEAIEKLIEERNAIGGDINDKFAEAKGLGFDTKIMKKVIALRRKSRAEREEEDSILSSYMQALGMDGLPLGEWADQQEHGETMPGRVVATV